MYFRTKDLSKFNSVCICYLKFDFQFPTKIIYTAHSKLLQINQFFII